ncbi:MAG: hypothetical protein KC470_11995, partial [Dehalococcoidia bacterium]|nr:hypothetical protein [Dehalococcoidia bacterium]
MALRALEPAPDPSPAILRRPPELALHSRSPFRARLWDALPLAVSLFLASSFVWAPFRAPVVLAVGLVVFFLYWLIRSYSIVVACVVGLRRISRWEKIHWPQAYSVWRASRPAAAQWAWPRHLVVIPNYKESVEGLSRTVAALAAQGNAGQLVVVMAMEDREPGAHAKAAELILRFRSQFADMFATFHPHGIEGETPGKGSNEAWALRDAHARLIVEDGQDIGRYTVTSCDADAVFHPRHFQALNFLFLTEPRRYRTFWQPTIFNSNNIWDIPAPLRIPDGLSGINRLSNLCLPGSVRFPTSCYSLSWQMLHEVDYWDEEVIPEDWHLYLKASYSLGDEVRCEALYLPLGNDCVLTDGWFKTLRAHYAQSVRHAWGASDVPYAWMATLNRQSPLSFRRKLTLAGAVTKVHSFWMAQWYLVTMGAHLPIFLNDHLGAEMPGWWLARPFQLPGPTWRLGNILAGDFSSAISPWLWLSLTSL